MIIVTGSITARPETFDEVLRLSQEHVDRSRQEPGCRSHAIYRDTENPSRLFFFEQWQDREALAAHFRVPASQAFVKAVRPLAAAASELNIFEAEPTRV